MVSATSGQQRSVALVEFPVQGETGTPDPASAASMIGPG